MFFAVSVGLVANTTTYLCFYGKTRLGLRPSAFKKGRRSPLSRRRIVGRRGRDEDYVRSTLTLRNLEGKAKCTVEASLETAAFLYSVENGGGGEMLVLPA